MKLFPLMFALYCFSAAEAHLNFILIAPPGSGKGTFSQYMVTRYGYQHICMGDIFRQELSQGTALGLAMKKELDEGRMLNDDLVWQILKHHLDKVLANKRWFIIDGSPRSQVIFDHLVAYCKNNGIEASTQFIKLIAPDEQCIERMAHRIACPNCARVYNTLSMPPKQKDVCDVCSVQLRVRSDDQLRTAAESRIKEYHEITEPLFDRAGTVFSTRSISTDQPLAVLYTTYDALVHAMPTA